MAAIEHPAIDDPPLASIRNIFEGHMRWIAGIQLAADDLEALSKARLIRNVGLIVNNYSPIDWGRIFHNVQVSPRHRGVHRN